jgi:hypothetical protein
MNSLSTTANDVIKTGAAIRSEKIEKACNIATAIREQRRQQQEALEAKLVANERGLTELRKLVDNWEGEDITLHTLEAVVLMKKKECEKTRQQVEETYNRWGSVPHYPGFRQMYATPSAQAQAPQRQSSTKTNKVSTKRQLMLQTQSSKPSVRLVPKVVVLMKERELEQLMAEASIKRGSSSSKSKKNQVARRVVAPSA